MRDVTLPVQDDEQDEELIRDQALIRAQAHIRELEAMITEVQNFQDRWASGRWHVNAHDLRRILTPHLKQNGTP